MALARCIGYNYFGYNYFHIPVWIQKTNGTVSTAYSMCDSEDKTKGKISIGKLELGIETTGVGGLVVLELEYKGKKIYNFVAKGEYWVNDGVYHKVIRYFKEKEEIFLTYEYGQCCDDYFNPPLKTNLFYIAVSVVNFPTKKIADIYTFGKEINLKNFDIAKQKSLTLMYLQCVINSLISSKKILYDVCDIFMDDEYLYSIFKNYKSCYETTGSYSCLRNYYNFYFDMVKIYLSAHYANPLDIIFNLSKLGINCIKKAIGPESFNMSSYDTGFENKYICSSGVGISRSVDFGHAKEVIKNINAQLQKDLKNRFKLK